LIYALSSGQKPQDAIDFAAAASCLKHSIMGDYNFAKLEEIKALIISGGAGRVQR
jgi:2-dehydro-3-deoxygluconokinase